MQPIMTLPTEATLEQLTTLFGALADPTRARMLLLIKDHEQRSGDLADLLNMTPSAISHQLRWLREKNLVASRKAGREIYYTLADDCVREIIDIALGHIEGR